MILSKSDKFLGVVKVAGCFEWDYNKWDYDAEGLDRILPVAIGGKLIPEILDTFKNIRTIGNLRHKYQDIPIYRTETGVYCERNYSSHERQGVYGVRASDLVRIFEGEGINLGNRKLYALEYEIRSVFERSGSSDGLTQEVLRSAAVDADSMIMEIEPKTVSDGLRRNHAYPEIIEHSRSL